MYIKTTFLRSKKEEMEGEIKRLLNKAALALEDEEYVDAREKNVLPHLKEFSLES